MTEYIYNIFCRKIKKNNLAHAYLFTLDANTNSNELIYKLSKLILCHNKQEENNQLIPCNSCISCKYFDSNTHPDFFIIKPDGNFIKIGQIRELLEKMPFNPIFNKRIILIEESHKLNLDAANTLLKTLEEPPPNNHFFLLSNQPELILQTITSRCINLKINQSFEITPTDLEELNIPTELLYLLKYLGISRKSQLIELVKNEFLNIRSSILNFILLKEKTLLYMFSLVNKLQNFKDFDIIIRILLSINRDILLLSLNLHQYLLNPELKNSNKKIIIEPIILHTLWLNSVQKLIDRNINKSLILEHALYFYIKLDKINLN